MKSKHKAVCEKLQLLPNKASVALRQGLRSAPQAQKVSANTHTLGWGWGVVGFGALLQECLHVFSFISC